MEESLVENQSEELEMNRLSWTELGTAPWLVDQLKALECALPTAIQINSLQAVNKILAAGGEKNEFIKQDDKLVDNSVNESVNNSGNNLDKSPDKNSDKNTGKNKGEEDALQDSIEVGLEEPIEDSIEKITLSQNTQSQRLVLVAPPSSREIVERIMPNVFERLHFLDYPVHMITQIKSFEEIKAVEEHAVDDEMKEVSLIFLVPPNEKYTMPYLMLALDEQIKALDYPVSRFVIRMSPEDVDAILNNGVENFNEYNNYKELEENKIQKQIRSQAPRNMGVIISGPTGYGKTLAYLVPMLSLLSHNLSQRQRVREMTNNGVGRSFRDQLGRSLLEGKGLLLDVMNPVALIVVPTESLGIQIKSLMFELLGEVQSEKMKMFVYKGPENVKITLVDEWRANSALRLPTDIAITTPENLTVLLDHNRIDPTKLQVVIFDEADMGLEQTSTTYLKRLFNDDDNLKISRFSFLVGATVTASLASLAVTEKILYWGNNFIATTTRFAPLTKDEETIGFSYSTPAAVDANNNIDTSTNEKCIKKRRILEPRVRLQLSPEAFKTKLKDLRPCLDPGLIHERVIASTDKGLSCIARMIRKEILEYERSFGANMNNDGDKQMTKFLKREVCLSTLSSFFHDEIIKKIRTTRVLVLFPDMDDVYESKKILCDEICGQGKFYLMLPESEYINKEFTIMLATSGSIRGLDFPALMHVYTIYLPTDDPREYIHLAGRVSEMRKQETIQGKGKIVTSLVSENEAEKMDRLAEILEFEFEDVTPPQE